MRRLRRGDVDASKVRPEAISSRPNGRRRRRNRGQAIVEMALVMSILMVLSMGIVDFGLFLTGYIRATNCTREAARAAVVRTPNATNICSNDFLSPLFSTYTVSVSPNYLTDPAGNPVTVTINATYTWSILGPTINAFIPGGSLANTNVRVQTTMRLEGRKI
jgi:Flp pilus assembly protein TadG